ncbi:MAG: HEAT repeat domain-containing protein, partial [Nodosilinea sp.]
LQPLQPGDLGAEVKYLKDRLRLANCLPLNITDAETYDEVTTAAVKSLQRQNNLLMSGVVDEETATAIQDGKLCQTFKDGEALRLGSQGEEVRLLQVQLNNWGFPLTGQRLEPTGVFDQATENALKKFEALFRLEPDGIFDPLDSELLWKPRKEALTSFFQNLKGASTSILASIVPFLESQNPEDRAAAARELGRREFDAKGAVPNLIALLQSQDQQDRSAAASALGSIGADAREAVPALIALLESQDQQDRSDAAAALGGIGADASEAVPVLTALLQSQDQADRNDAAVALGRIGADAREAVPALISLLQSQNQQDRSIAANALGGIGGDASEAVPLLVALLQSQDKEDRRIAANALGGIGAVEEEVIPALTTLLRSDSVADRTNGATALGNIGSDAKEAVPALIPLLSDNAQVNEVSDPVSREVMEALASIGSEEAISPLLELSRSPSFDRNTEAAFMLLRLDPSLSTLLDKLRSEFTQVRKSSALVLGFSETSNQEVVSALRNVLENQNEDLKVRRQAAISLAMLGQDIDSSNVNDALQVSYEGAVETWKSCPRRIVDLDLQDERRHFDSIYEACTTQKKGIGGGLVETVKKLFGR